MRTMKEHHETAMLGKKVVIPIYVFFEVAPGLLLPGYCRSSFRDKNSPDYRHHDIGLRVCCSVPKSFQ
jgi:hypothetical protein